MSKREIDRLDVIKRVIRKEINGTKAAALLSLTVRHIRRLKRRIKEDGAKGLIHGNRGKPSNRKVPEKERKKIIALLHKHYSDFGPTFASEQLSENHKLSYDPKTICAIQIAEGLRKPAQRKKQTEHHEWRKRKDALGELLQFDGSYDDWLEGRGDTSEQCLLLAIDDATGIVTHAAFASNEGTMPVFGFWRDYILANGKPRAIYTDKFSTYKMTQQVSIENPDTKTQFQRACNTLDVQPIFANSPQAKGRVERVFRTLQDRLMKELRLAHISTEEDANVFLKDIFLPKFNAKFSVEPASKANLHCPLTAEEKKYLNSTFSRHTKRTVQNDFTLALDKTWYQLTKCQPCIVRKKERVTVEEHLDDTIHIRHRGKDLNFEILPMRPKKTRETTWVLAATREPVKPAANNPWRTFHYGKQLTHAAK